QLGSHGPSYFERYPAHFERFKPVCKTADLGSCSRQDIVNAYDNSIGYTDHFLNQAIHTLRGLQDDDTAMIYVSDHGESLGEKGLYLHGVPYAIAEFARDRGLDETCLRHRAGQYTDHDALFPSERDLFAQCAG
ncbi:sulfatase-like hydrolase/transferase, partial [Xanthomonas hortorum]|uniref:sulfatase-like hydrolase/transferase n=1 Tax=Xanthomonas hortorum TaxID=56454 RepID=UPI0005C493F0